MNFIIDFYKGLDTVNLIIFWGVIIVVLLLLIFAIIIANKNKKLKEIIATKEIELDDTKNELAIKNGEDILNTNTKESRINNIEIKKDSSNYNIDIPLKKENELDTEINNNQNIKQNEELTMPVLEEKKFIAEEHVMEYSDELFSLPNIKKTTEINKEEKEQLKKETPKEIIIPSAPYQKNVLREMSLSQTSPIGIIKKENNKEKELAYAKELQESFNIENENKEINQAEITKNSIQTNNIPKVNNNNDNKEKYLEEVSKKLANAKKLDDINRTEYELKQEEDAIISYEELMRKKDSIQIIDEEDAVISIEELIERKNKEEKLYNITNEEENTEFIKELKNFRSDL